MQRPLVRILFVLGLFYLAFVAPWWIVFILTLTGAYIFPIFFEFFLVGGILDALVIEGRHIPIIIFWALLFISIEYSKKYLIFYNNE